MTSSPDEVLVRVVRDLVLALPPPTVQALAEMLREVEASSPTGAFRLLEVAPSPPARAVVSSLLAAWQACPEVDGRTLGLMARSAALVREGAETAQSLTAVWTGPGTPHVPLRHSRQVLQDVIRFARKRLVIVSFAAYRVPSVLADLQDAVGRGVDVRLVLETKADSGGKLSQDAADALRELPSVVGFYVWPAEMRKTTHSSLHAKAALADGSLALVTSANLTASALDRNMELGVLVRGGPLPEALLRHFDELCSAGQLRLAEAN